MRMKQSRVRKISLKPRVVTKDSEGVPEISYGNAIEKYGEVWPATSRLQAETYGNRINGIMNVKLRGTYEIVMDGNVAGYKFKEGTIHEGDGVCIYSAGAPDYKVISIKPYKPLRLEIERL